MLDGILSQTYRQLLERLFAVDAMEMANCASVDVFSHPLSHAKLPSEVKLLVELEDPRQQDNFAILLNPTLAARVLAQQGLELHASCFPVDHWPPWIVPIERVRLIHGHVQQSLRVNSTI